MVKKRLALRQPTANRKAGFTSLDLVEVAAKARPPVTAGSWITVNFHPFEEQKKDRVNNKKNKHQDAKEVRLRPGTDVSDLKIKAEKARGFLAEGYKVGIQLQFRGRERAHPEMGIQMIDRFAEMVSDSGKLEQRPRREGRRVDALLAPLQGVGKKSPELIAKAAQKAAEEAAAAAAEEDGDNEAAETSDVPARPRRAPISNGC